MKEVLPCSAHVSDAMSKRSRKPTSSKESVCSGTGGRDILQALSILHAPATLYSSNRKQSEQMSKSTIVRMGSFSKEPLYYTILSKDPL